MSPGDLMAQGLMALLWRPDEITGLYAMGGVQERLHIIHYILLNLNLHAMMNYIYIYIYLIFYMMT